MLTDNTVSVLLNTTPPGATTPSFAAQQTFATGSVPVSVTAADVNGDGKPDLIVANNNDNTVSVLLNTTAPGATTPSFATQQTFATGSGPHSVTAADVNGDGKPDLIVANAERQHGVGAAQHHRPGRHHAQLRRPADLRHRQQPDSVTAADVNGDGKPDLIVANEDGNTVSVLLNTTAPGATTPSFATQQTFATGSGPCSVTAADVNGDGKPDLIVANATTPRFRCCSTPRHRSLKATLAFDSNSFATSQLRHKGEVLKMTIRAGTNREPRTPRNSRIGGRARTIIVACGAGLGRS